MPEYLHPGVYIEETSYRGKPIQGVSTSTAGFVGAARKGAEGRATFVGSFAQFRRLFGEPIGEAEAGLGNYLGHAVKAFFENGGARCYAVRVLAGDALRSGAAIEQGIVLRLSSGVTVRGPTQTLRLNALRGVAQGAVLNVFTRRDATSPFQQTRTLTVTSHDAMRGTITVGAGDIPAGVVLEPANTVLLLNGGTPGGVAPAGGGAVFSASNRGIDGDTLAVEIRPRDRPPVALTATSARRASPLLTLDPSGAAPAAGATLLEFSPASLRRLRVGDRIAVGASTDRDVQAIADGDLSLAIAAGSAGADYSGGGAQLSLVQRGVTVLAIPLGAAPPAVAINMSGGGPFPTLAVPHEIAALLRVGDILAISGGGNTTRLAVTAARVAQEIAAGTHVTIVAGLGAAEALGATCRVSRTSTANAVMLRVYVGDAASFTAPAGAAPEAVAVSDGVAVDPSHVLLVDPGENMLVLSRVAGEFPAGVANADWTTIEALQVVADGQATVRVATTAGFYSGATVELDSGSRKAEAIVQSLDVAARTITFTAGVALGAGNVISLPSDPAARHVVLRCCEVDVLVYENGVLKESFDGLTWNDDATTDAGLRFYAMRLNDREVGSKLVSVVPPAVANPALAGAPATADGQSRRLTGGSNGGDLTEIDLIGSDNGPGQRTGIQALSERDDIAMVAVPGVTGEAVQGALITHAELMRYRVAVLDAPLGAQDVTALQAHRNNYDSKYAAYYAPWVRALNVARNGRVESFPPSAYAMGIYARSDNTVGVHKAPANEVVRNISDLVLPFTAAEQDVLNPVGINLIRDLSPRGLRLWGARTLSSDPEWTYLNVRRLFIFIEHSIDIGTQWVVFEPNSEALWARVIETINSFLFGVWKSGALMGTTPEEGYFIRCDRTTMTQDDVDNGRLVCEIGLAPVKPAEFVIFRIGQFTASTN
ncbi:MAG TPA: phage tail sheath subtilisin-like domain-containing protein [Burkholderiaceae bacterium]|nr:phage tail sheath subtilisin-like domain-containing protein [Burkholderiaceae bacterium]